MSPRDVSKTNWASVEEYEAELIASLCPGIRGAVAFLRHYGFDTCDSGDGSHAKAGMEGAFDEPMVAIRISLESLATETVRCARLLERFGVPNIAVQATYSPGDTVPMIIIVHEKLLEVKL
jgi:hypothetical protein